MNMPVLALFMRSLRVESRKGATYWRRFFLIAIIFIGLIWAHQMMRFIGAAGISFFQAVIYINFFFITLIGLSFFSSSITEEKEEMTLGLLRMTELSHVAILLGKSTSRLTGALFIILCQVPFTFLAVALGGVSTHQILAAYTALIAYLVLLANVSLLASVIFKDTRRATIATALFILPFIFLPLIISTVRISAGKPSGPVIDWLIRFSVFSRLGEVLSTGFSGSVTGFQVISNIVLGALFFGLSWLLFDIFNRQEKPAEPVRGILFRRKSPLRWLGTGKIGKRALAWKDFNFISGGRVMILAKCLAMLLIAGGIALYQWNARKRIDREFIGNTLAWGSFFGFLLEFAFYAGRMFADEIRWKTLGSITILPRRFLAVTLEKCLGAMYSMLFWIPFFIAGYLLSPGDVADAVEEILTIESLHGCVWYVYFIYLVVYLSLVMKHGAFLVGILALWVTQAIIGALNIGCMIRSGSGSMNMSTISFLIIVVICILHWRIYKRLRNKAAME